MGIARTLVGFAPPCADADESEGGTVRRLSMTLGAALLTASMIASCGSDDDDDAAGDVVEANAEFCENLGAYTTAVGDFAALDSSTASKDDYESAADEVRSTHEAMVDSAADLGEEQWENLLTQTDALVEQLQDAPDDQAVQSVLDAAQPQAAAVQASAATLNTALWR